MVKTIIIGIWLLIVAFGTVWLGHIMREQPDTKTSEVVEEEVEFENHSVELMSVPVMVSGKVDGYVLIKLSYLTAKNAKKSSIPVDPFIEDEVYRQFFGAYSDANQIEKIRIDDVREQIIASINQRFDQPVLKDIMIEQFSYIAADQVRDIKRNKSDS